MWFLDTTTSERGSLGQKKGGAPSRCAEHPPLSREAAKRFCRRLAVSWLGWSWSNSESREEGGFDLGRIGGASDVLATYAVGEGLFDRSFDGCRLLLESEAMAN